MHGCHAAVFNVLVGGLKGTYFSKRKIQLPDSSIDLGLIGDKSLYVHVLALVSIFTKL